MVGRPFQRQLTDLIVIFIAKTNHIDKWTTYRPYFNSTTGKSIAILADILKADKEELQTLWLADQLYNVIEGQPMP